MFRRLIASQPRSAQRARTGPGLVALLGHGVVVAGAVVGTLRASDPPHVIRAVVMPWHDAPDRRAPPGVPVPPRAPIVEDPIGFPITVPPGLPPIEPSRPSDATQWLQSSRAVGDGPSAPDATTPWTADVVEEPPVLLAGRQPSYPEALRAAGVTGRVVVQAVIDTLGRAEPEVTVVESSHAGFEPAALDYVHHAVFRPGRVHGRRVRVLIRLPVDFRLMSVQ
jgi:periplasmic protein TonB